MALNPFEDNQQTANRERGNFALGIARVVSVPSDAGHQVGIQPVTETGEGTRTNPSSATVLATQRGDVSLPSVDDLVVFGRFKNRQNVVLGTLYSKQSSIREYAGAQRTIGHEATNANITIEEDGSITIEPAEDKGVSIEGGVNNPLSFPHTEWSTSLSDEEIWSVDLQSDEELTVYRMELATKGGAVRQDFTLDLVDESDGTVLASTNDVFQGAATSATGATVSARLTNDTGGRKVAAISSKISVTRT